MCVRAEWVGTSACHCSEVHSLPTSALYCSSNCTPLVSPRATSSAGTDVVIGSARNKTTSRASCVAFSGHVAVTPVAPQSATALVGGPTA